MKKFENYDTAVQAAHETLRMHDELLRLRDEVEELREYRRKYAELLQTGIEHGRHMLGGMLELALKPGVLQAISKANENPVPNN